MLLDIPALCVRWLAATWVTTALLLGCVAESAEADPTDPSDEERSDEGREQSAQQPSEVALGGGNSPHATETNVTGVFCLDHEICGEGSACVVVDGSDAGDGFSRCSFVLLADSTPCSTAADCAGGLQCLQLLGGLDAGVERICDALPMSGPGPRR